jgi:hypothetical protein
MAKSDMSFSVQAKGRCVAALEWSGSSLDTVFAQRSNLVNRRFWTMLRDLLRFNALTTRIAQSGTDAQLSQSLGDFCRNRFQRRVLRLVLFAHDGLHLELPHGKQMLQFPVATMVRFCHNHGLLQISNRPQWWTVQGGAKHYVEKIVARIGDKRLNTPVRRVEYVHASNSKAAACASAPTPVPSFLTKSSLPPTPIRRWPCLGAPYPAGAQHPGRHSLPAQPRRAAHRHLRAAQAPGRLGRMELRTRQVPHPTSRAACACTTCSTGCSPCRGSRA